MLSLVDPATGVPRELRPATGRVLRIRAGNGPRVAVIADLLRRLAERERWLVSVQGRSDLTDRQLLQLNVHPFHEPAADVSVEVAVLGVGDATQSCAGRVLEIAPTLAKIDLHEADAEVDPLAARLVLLSTPYAVPVTVDRAAVLAAHERIARWRALVCAWAEQPSAPMPAEPVAAVVRRLADNLDGAGALAALDDLAGTAAVAPGARFEAFAHLDRLLGLDLAADVGRAPR